MNRVFFADIDTQKDFMLPSGALYVQGAERLIPKMRRLIDAARENKIFVMSSVDAHDIGDREFQEFVPHCLKGTDGQKKIGETLLPRALTLENRLYDMNLMDLIRKYPQVVVEKQELDLFSNPMTERILRALPGHALVFGVATDYCVRLAALGFRRLGIKTALITDAVRPVGAESGEKALEEMRKAGVDFTTTDAILELYAA